MEFCIPNRRAKAQVEVWEASIREVRPALAALWETLDDAELKRVDRYRYTAQRERFVVARGMLRHLLAAKVGLHPAQVRFGYSEHGKPYLLPATFPAALAGAKLTFNMAHSGDCILMAVAWGRDVGIDVEQVHANVDFIRLAERYFAPPEAEALLSLDPKDHCDAFFKLWTRKEAFVKALGRGVAYGLNRFTVSLETPVRVQFEMSDAGGAWEAESSPGRSAAEQAQDWRILDLEVPAGYAGALCFDDREQKAPEIEKRIWTGPIEN